MTAATTTIAAASGRILWRYHAGAPVKSAVAYSRGRLYFGDYGGSVTALRTNGSVAWRRGGLGEVYATPAVAFGRVYVGSKSGSVPGEARPGSQVTALRIPASRSQGRKLTS